MEVELKAVFGDDSFEKEYDAGTPDPAGDYSDKDEVSTTKKAKSGVRLHWTPLLQSQCYQLYFTK